MGNKLLLFVISQLLIIFYVPHVLPQPPPYLMQTTPVQQIPFYYPPNLNVFNCSGTNEGAAQFQPWYSHYITPTMLPTDNINFTSTSINYANPNNYPIPEDPIDCMSSSQLRNGSCTSFYTCIYVMNGTINQSPHCPASMYCCMLPTCALIIGTQTRYGHCRPSRTCPGIFDTVLGISVGCPDPINNPCCVAEEVNITCPRNYDRYVNSLVKSYGLLNMTSKAVATPQRVLAWAPFLLSSFDDVVGMCVNDCHKVSFLQFFMNVMSEMFMFTNGSVGLYKRLLDWKGVSMGLLPSSYFSYYSPYVFSTVIRNLFQNYNLVQLFGRRSFLSAARIIDFLNQQVLSPNQVAANYSSQFTLISWRSYKYFARFSDCAPIYIDGVECSNGQGLCSIPRIPAMMNISEFWLYCPKTLHLLTNDCSGYPANAVCCAKPYFPLKFGANLVKSEFNDIVVAIHQGQYKDVSIISDLVKVLTNASEALYRATKGRAYFRTITVLNQWNGTDGNATYETFRDADIKVVPEFSNQARSLSLGSCGEPGLGVFLSQNHLRQIGASQTIAKLFAMNRWGFGDEVPSTLSEVLYVPDDRRQGSVTLRAGSSCSVNMNINYQPTYGSGQKFNISILSLNQFSVASFAFRPDIFPIENAEFCATTTIPHCDDTRRHNSESNTPHNRICNRTSTLTTILHSNDFDQTQNSPRFVGNTAPTFKFLQYPQITDHVIAIVADFSGSLTPSYTSIMLNAIISFLQIVPDEVHVVLACVGPENKVVLQTAPFQPLEPFVQPTGALHTGRQRLIERVKEWMYFIRPVLGPKNTSVLKGIEQLVNTYLPQKQYRLKILCFSDFFGVGPSDTRLLLRIQEAGYSIWPVALWPNDKLFRTQLYSTTWYPLYHYMQLLANSTYGRWQFIADTTSMLHWYYVLGTFLDDNNFGTPILIDTYTAKIGENISIPFRIPTGYGLNTSIVIDHDALLIPVTISGSSPFFQQNCTRDDRGFQKTFRVVCRLGDLSSPSNPTHTLTLNFGRDSQVYLAAKDDRINTQKTITAMIISRAFEFGSAYTGDNDVPKPWIDPWRNRIASLPDTYPKAEARLTRNSVRFVFERSSKFRFPKVFAILSMGPNALVGCQVEYDLYLVNYTPGPNPAGPNMKLVTSAGKMYDDGQCEDGFANDGIYTALLTGAISNGTYSAFVRLKATTAAPSCTVKPPGIALVGYPNDNTLVNPATGTPVVMSFYKSAGAFDVIVPPGAETVFPLGLVTVHSCGVRDVILLSDFSTNEQYKLPTNFTLYCNVIPLVVESRYNIKPITYNLAIAGQVMELNQHTRYWTNATATSSTPTVKQPDGRDAIPLVITMSPAVVLPVYYAVVWATDGRENYATRSEINSINLPTYANNGTGRITNLPVFTDITTSFPRPDDAWPTAIIFSCVAGSVLAVLLIIFVVFCFGRRRPSRRLLIPHQQQPYGYVEDNRLSIVSSSRHNNSAVQPLPTSSTRNKQSMAMTTPVPPCYPPPPGPPLPPPYHFNPHRPGAYQRQQFRNPNNNVINNNLMNQSSEIAFHRHQQMSPQNQYTTNLTIMGTADRQNLANLSRQMHYSNNNNSMRPTMF